MRKITQQSIEVANWLADSAKKELELLQQELTTPLPEFCTTAEAKQEFREKFKKAQNLAACNPLLRCHKDQVAHWLAAHTSTLGSFLDQTQWQALDAAGYNKKLVRKSIEQAADRFTDINAHIIIQSVTAVAETAGFNRPLTNRQGKGTGVLVIGDADGRALVAKVSKTREGVQLHLDMTGFCNEKCHPLMDHILKGLAERQIILDNPKRRSHFRPDGVLPSESRTNTKTANAHKASEQQDARQRNRRRQAEQMKVRA